MSESEPVTFGTDHPEYYAELLRKTARPADRRVQSDKQPSSIIPDIQAVDGPLSKRIQTLLDVIANISLCRQGNVAASMVCLKGNKCGLETRLYIVFDHQRDDAARACPEHLGTIIEILRRVPYEPPEMGGSQKVIMPKFRENVVEICTVIHNHSFDIFAYRVNKRDPSKLPEIQRLIDQDSEHFTSQDRSMLVEFLDHMKLIIAAVANAQDTKRLSPDGIGMLVGMYSHWTNHNLLPKDGLADSKLTLLDNAETWLDKKHHIYFRLRRWALKIMSFVISANRLFMLTQSRRLRPILHGEFSVRVLPSPITTPYRCDLSPETMQVALNTALAGTSYLSPGWNEARESFLQRLLEQRQDPEGVVCWDPTVHAELAMIMAMVNDEIEHVLPCIGVSKLSCIMCSHYIHTFNEVMERKIAIRGSHGKAYPGWFWPNLPSHDQELRPAFLRCMRQQLLTDFKQHEERRLSDSGVGSGFPSMRFDETKDTIDGIYAQFMKAVGL